MENTSTVLSQIKDELGRITPENRTLIFSDIIYPALATLRMLTEEGRSGALPRGIVDNLYSWAEIAAGGYSMSHVYLERIRRLCSQYSILAQAQEFGAPVIPSAPLVRTSKKKVPASKVA